MVAVPTRYVNRQALTYYLLALPAIVLEAVFSLGIASNPQNALSSGAGAFAPIIQYLPWVIVGLSFYALVAFRPSILVSLLTASFFISAITNSQAGALGVQGGFGLSVALVIVTTFSALIGFNYSRGAKVRSGRDLRIESRGPLGSQVVSTGFEFVLPLIITLAMVALVSGVVGAIKLQTQVLPEPLSTLSSLYLKTRFGLVFITIAVAGALIWATRQLLEPIILYFTITHHDAISLALDEVQDITKKVRKEARRKPSAGLSRLIFAILVGVGVVALAVQTLGGQAVYNDLMSVLSYHAPRPSSTESNLANAANNYASVFAGYLNQGEQFLRTLFRILWG